MTTEIQIRPQAEESAAEQLTHLLPSLLNCKKAQVQAAEIIPKLTIPADTTWLMARIASLLNPYFEKETPQAIRQMEARDWADALQGKPQWAVDRAVRWWKSADNPKRQKRPLEGDIAERTHLEMKCIRDAQAGISMAGKAYRRAEEHSKREPLTDEQKAAADRLVAPFMKRVVGYEWDGN